MNTKEQAYSCLDHIDIMIEEWVNTHERAPEIDMLMDKKAPCAWCSQDAVYYIIELTINEEST